MNIQSYFLQGAHSMSTCGHLKTNSIICTYLHDNKYKSSLFFIGYHKQLCTNYLVIGKQHLCINCIELELLDQETFSWLLSLFFVALERLALHIILSLEVW